MVTQLTKRRRIVCLALTLPDHFAIGMHAQYGKRLNNSFCGASDCARFINIFDTKQPPTVMRVRIQIAGHGSDQ